MKVISCHSCVRPPMVSVFTQKIKAFSLLSGSHSTILQDICPSFHVVSVSHMPLFSFLLIPGTFQTYRLFIYLSLVHFSPDDCRERFFLLLFFCFFFSKICIWLSSEQHTITTLLSFEICFLMPGFDGLKNIIWIPVLCWIYHLKLVNSWMAKWYCFLLQVTLIYSNQTKKGKMTFQLLIALWIPLLTYLALEEKVEIVFYSFMSEIHSFFYTPQTCISSGKKFCLVLNEPKFHHGLKF